MYDANGISSNMIIEKVPANKIDLNRSDIIVFFNVTPPKI